MKAIKYFSGIALLLAVMTGCKKEEFNDTSFINGVTAPGKLSVMFNITQDNTGLVTITPAGEGATSYDVYFGDGGSTPTNVAGGKSIQHKYAEGQYNVKITAKGATGKTTDLVQPLTVSFKAPENLKTTITTSGLTASISASALYETNFKVYYGDSLTVNPLHFGTFLEGTTITHTYPNAGTYTVKIVALSGGAATTELTQTVKVGKQIDLPVTFDDPNFDLTMSDFGGNSSSIAADPTNAANKVLKAVKTAGSEVWAGTTIGTAAGFATKIPLTATSKKMTMRVYSPAAGLDIKLKLEDHADGTHAIETDKLTTVANAWETITFDFSTVAAGTPAFNAAWTYDKASVFFNFGVAGDGKTYYADDLKFVPALAQVSLPVTFDDPTVDYTTTDFGNNSTVTGADPTNAANKVKITTKPNGAEVWAGTTIGTAAGFSAKVPITATNSKMSVRVYSPAVGLDIKLKLEDHNDGTHSIETDKLTTVANAWETITFDFNTLASGTPAYNAAYNYDKASLFFDFGVAGSGKKFYWDDVQFVSTPTVLALPVTFESTAFSYPFTDFDGGAVTIVNNPASAGINTSAKVAKMVKSAGQTWGGSYLTLPSPIDFSTKKTFTMKVYSPRVGAHVLLKVENLTDGTISYEKEVSTTVANTWETLTFDYSAINTAKSYSKITLIFDNGTAGDGSVNYTWYLDDITLN
ncbi:PKD domain-containing protein [Mucilaginibacter mali]|uniref:PKD domain-containing protein n=1 Tax=Mucilaginibacter mali TaxID=2740462 RepID=A0A7D4QTT8_9SPHI|nr:PKD domain-containing protein [Mucilaginibacter mali]QKJ30749.1 PKD domain-containing protein [Mucilaginibacter mali]